MAGVIVAALVLGACGEGEQQPAAAKPDRGSDHRAIAEVMHGYFDAYFHGRGAEACARYTAALRRSTDRQARRAGISGGCAGLLAQTGPIIVAEAPRGQRKEFLAKTATSRVDVRFSGNDLALASLTMPGEHRASGKRTELYREHGEWRISRFAILEGVPWP